MNLKMTQSQESIDEATTSYHDGSFDINNEE